MTSDVVHVAEPVGQLQHALSVENVRAQVGAIQALMAGAMRDGEHYGVIPGTNKPSLLKPGAEKLCMMFRLSPAYSVSRGDLSAGHRDYEVVCTLTSIRSGEVWGSGVGSCSTMETRYRFRRSETDTGLPIPRDYRDNKGAYRAQGFKAAKDAEGKWYWAKVERVEHDNPADYYNTALKMAKKRALVDAVLTVTAASDIFTQDTEDLAENGAIQPAQTEAKKTPQPKNGQEPNAQPDAQSDAQPTCVQRLYDALKGDVDELGRLTKFFSKRENRDVPGCSNWAKLSEERAKVALQAWEREQLAGGSK